MKKQFRRKRYYLVRREAGLFWPVERDMPAFADVDEEEFVVRLPRRRELLSVSESSEAERLETEPADLPAEGEMPRIPRRHLL